MEKMNPTALILIVMANFFWAVAQVVGKKALNQMGATSFNAIRFSVMIPFILLIVYMTQSWKSIPVNGYLLIAILCGVLGLFAGCYLFFYLLKKTAAHLVIPIGNSQLFWIILLSGILLGENITIFLLISAVAIFSGSFIISKKGRPKNPRNDKNRLDWMILSAIFVAFLWGLTVVLNKYALEGGFIYSNLLLIEVVVAAVLFNFTLVIKGNIRKTYFTKSSPMRRDVRMSVASALFGFLPGSQLYLMALQIEKASILAPFFGLTLLFGFLLSVLILAERPSKKAIVGTVLILASLVLVTF